MFGLSAVAVEREIVGSDKEAELMGGVAVLEFRIPLADWTAACAV